MSNLADLTIVEAGKKMAAGELTAVDLARACLENAEKNKSRDTKKDTVTTARQD